MSLTLLSYVGYNIIETLMKGKTKMTKRKFDGIFSLLTKSVMSLLLGVSLYILLDVAKMKCDPNAFLERGSAVIPTVEAVLAAVAVYLVFAFVAVKFRPK